jgi:hypothetical protein
LPELFESSTIRGGVYKSKTLVEVCLVMLLVFVVLLLAIVFSYQILVIGVIVISLQLLGFELQC